MHACMDDSTCSYEKPCDHTVVLYKVIQLASKEDMHMSKTVDTNLTS